MKKIYNSALIAFSMYSKIPMPQCEWSEENMAYSMCFFPLIGVVLGGLTWLVGVFGCRIGLTPTLYAVILVLLPWLATGGIHLDGLLDTADAMSSWQERERRLEILKDSHAGAFAIISCVVYFLFYFGIYSQVTLRAFPILAASFMLSRTLSALAVITFPKAKKTGSMSAIARGSSDRHVMVTMIVYLILIFIYMMVMDWKLGLICYGTAWLTYLGYYKKAMKYFGGTTGDLAGCFLSLCELFMAATTILAVLIPGI